MSRASDSVFLAVVFVIAAGAMDLGAFALLMTAALFAGIGFVALMITLTLHKAAVWLGRR
jgi:hypothetical protein